MAKRQRPSAVEGDTDLFGQPVKRPPVGRQPYHATNDIGLIEEVLRTACSDYNYVLVGMAEQVYRKVDKEYIEPVPVDVENAVHQLLAQKWLTVGGCHYYRYGRDCQPANSVLVPKATKRTLSHWAAVAPQGLSA